MLEILPQRAISLDETKHFENPKFKWKFPIQLKYSSTVEIFYEPCSTRVNLYLLMNFPNWDSLFVDI